MYTEPVNLSFGARSTAISGLSSRFAGNALRVPDASTTFQHEFRVLPAPKLTHETFGLKRLEFDFAITTPESRFGSENARFE